MQCKQKYFQSWSWRERGRKMVIFQRKLVISQEQWKTKIGLWPRLSLALHWVSFQLSPENSKKLKLGGALYKAGGPKSGTSKPQAKTRVRFMGKEQQVLSLKTSTLPQSAASMFSPFGLGPRMNDSWNFPTWELSFPRNDSSIGGTFVPWNLRSLTLIITEPLILA